MALNGSTRRSSDSWKGSKPTHDSFDAWVNQNGKDAFKDFKKAHPTTKHSYDTWRQTEQIYGPYLCYVTSVIWHEDGDSDDGSTKRRRISRVPDENPKKTASTNGSGPPRIAGSATPTPAVKTDEVNASGKRKRKPRKKYMSQELVASDEEPVEGVEAAAPIVEKHTTTAPAVTLNGRRKSGTRRPRKKPISDETILPEDEADEPMEIDAHPIASPLPVRSAPYTGPAARQSESPKKATPKQASVKKPRKSFLSEEMVLDEVTDNGEASIAEVIRPATAPATKPQDPGNDIKTEANADEAAESENEGTPDTSAANTRRGLRNRKPAQQRPYYHDAQVFEDVETEEDDDSEIEVVSREESLESPTLSKPKHFKGKGRAWKKDGSDEDEEFVTPKEKKAVKAARAKADRERAKVQKEKKDDETGDITCALWEALIEARAEHVLNITNSNQMSSRGSQEPQSNGAVQIMSPDTPEDTFKEAPKQMRRPGQPKESLSEDVVRDNSDNETPHATPSQPPKRGRGRPRKSALSSELVRDESDDEPPAVTEQPSPPLQKATSPGDTTNFSTPPKTKPKSRPSTAKSTVEATTPKKRGRPRKSPAVTPAQSASKPTIDPIDPNPQRHSSAAPDTPDSKPAQATPTVSAALDDYPMPTLHRGAALIESLYPRDTRESPCANSASTPAPEPPHKAPPAPSMVAAERPTVSPPAAAPPLDVQEDKDKDKSDENAVQAVSETRPEVSFETVGDEDEGNMSADMELSSDSEL